MKQIGFTITDAAALCGCSRNTIHRWIRQGRLNTVRISQRKQLIHPEEMKRFALENLIDAEIV